MLLSALTERVPLRTGVIAAARDFGDFIRVEEPDGTLHAWSPDCHVVVLPDRPAKLFLRTATVKSLLHGGMRLRRMIVAEMGGAWLHVLDGQMHFASCRKTVAQVDTVKTPLPPRDGNSYAHQPINGVRLYMQDRRLLLTGKDLDP